MITTFMKAKLNAVTNSNIFSSIISNNKGQKIKLVTKKPLVSATGFIMLQ